MRKTEFALNYYRPPKWDEMHPVPSNQHDKKYLQILSDHSFNNISIPIPLVDRYCKGRRWTQRELDMCYDAWKNGISLTRLSATLNRNPQDMIYKLLEQCKKDGVNFTQKYRSEGSRNWNREVENCARSLFEAGLPAWKIAVIFRVDFEHVEKSLFLKRKGYGHCKKNPFTICTDHKQLVNFNIVNSSPHKIRSALDAFAGEGRFTKIIDQVDSIQNITAIEAEKDTFVRASNKNWRSNIVWINDDNLNYFNMAEQEGKKFDLIDLDPFVTCHKQLDLVWGLLRDNAYLFVTFGGEYRRSFIRSNRKSISKRYGFFNKKLDNQEYLEVVPYYFLGHIAGKSVQFDFTFEIIRAVRYANNCRFWLKVLKRDKTDAMKWLSENTIAEFGGRKFLNPVIPRFKEVRREIDDAKKGQFYL